MLTTLQISIIVGIAILFFGTALVRRMTKQALGIKREVKKTMDEFEKEDESKQISVSN